MRKAVRILLWLGGGVALLLALAFHLLYAPAPPEPALSARPGPGTIRVGGRDRGYLLYAPARRLAAPPLLVVFHGSMGSPGTIRIETGYGFDRLADRDGFVLAYPQGHDGNWNDCRRTADFSARRLGVDDVAFFDALVARLVRELGVDPARVYVVGLSNGGHFVYRLALERPDRIAGAAVFAASLPTRDNSICAARGRPPPIMIVNGTSDPISPYDGGTVTMFGFGNRGTVLSAWESAATLARAGGTAGPPVDQPNRPRLHPRPHLGRALALARPGPERGRAAHRPRRRPCRPPAGLPPAPPARPSHHRDRRA